jgi:hypothetical protein
MPKTGQKMQNVKQTAVKFKKGMFYDAELSTKIPWAHATLRSAKLVQYFMKLTPGICQTTL